MLNQYLRRLTKNQKCGRKEEILPLIFKYFTYEEFFLLYKRNRTKDCLLLSEKL